MKWRERKWRSVFPHEGVLISGVRQHAWAALLKPRAFMEYAHCRFQCWAVLPGDVFIDFQRDVWHVVRTVRASHVETTPISGQMFQAVERGDLDPHDPRMVVTTETHARPLRWLPATGERATTARMLS